MIIEFTVENFRSIKDEQILSLYSDKKKDILSENMINLNDDKFSVLKTLGLYGANASGKSNVLRAMHALSFLVRSSGKFQLDEDIDCYEPFLLDVSSMKKPTIFEIEFYGHDKLRYIYKVEFNKTTILYESLYYYPSRKSALLFERNNVDKSPKFGSKMTGKKDISFLENNLYLSKIANSGGASKLIKDVYRYLIINLNIIDGCASCNHPSVLTTRMIYHRDSNFKDKVVAFLKAADTGINGIDVNKQNKEINFKFPNEIPEQIKKKFIEGSQLEPFFYHEQHDGDNIKSIPFDYTLESLGTQKMYYLASHIIDALEDGETIIIDEIGGNMHPHMSEFIIELFNNPNSNPNNAQLIFSTHDLSLMNSKTMRKEQFYFSEKNSKGITELFSMNDFNKNEIRNGGPFAKWYSEGRMDAVPNINKSIFIDSLNFGEETTNA